MGYLVNHPGGLAGVQGIGYDYVLGSGGRLRPVRERPPDGASALSHPARCGAWLPSTEKVELAHGPIPSRLFEFGLRWFQDDPGTERFFAVRWDGRRLPAGGSRTGRDGFVPHLHAALQGVVAEFHSHGTSRAFFSKTDDGDELGFRIYGVVGRLDSDRLPELSLRVGVYGHFAPLDWPQVFGGPDPGVRLMGERDTPNE